jgi:UPF0755 protein
MSARSTATFLALLVPAVATLAAYEGSRRVEAILTAPAESRADFPVLFEVEKGRSAAAIARQLQDERLVVDARVLSAWLQVSGMASHLRAGEYQVEQPPSVVDVADLLVSGRVFLHPVTLPEGLTLAESAARMAASGLWSEADLLAAFRDPAPVRDLDADAADLEGYLYPETYHFPKGEPPAAVARSLVDRFRATWASLGGPASGRSAHEVATLASLVEKETALSDEHPLVASVYANRLRLGMKLDCDPTVIRALQEAGQWTGGPLQLTDLAFPSPWNTYVVAGLPPGPIASPGEASLRAALHPAQSEYLYFVATGLGGHRFAATLKEHEANVALYREHQRDERQQAKEAGGR